MSLPVLCLAAIFVGEAFEKGFGLAVVLWRDLEFLREAVGDLAGHLVAHRGVELISPQQESLT